MKQVKKTKKPDDSQDEEQFPTINARFEEKLPGILYEINYALQMVRPKLDNVRVSIRDLRDHVGFELDKARLSIEKAEWESRSDPEESQKLKEWKLKLEGILTQFPEESARSSVDFLNSLSDELRRVFFLEEPPTIIDDEDEY
jgi:hypothetical protein